MNTGVLPYDAARVVWNGTMFLATVVSTPSSRTRTTRRPVGPPCDVVVIPLPLPPPLSAPYLPKSTHFPPMQHEINYILCSQDHSWY